MKVWVLVSLALLESLRKYELQAPWQIYRVLEDLKSCLRKQKLSLISKCKKMMRWQAARSRRSWRNTEFPYVQPPCEEQERSLVGLCRRRRIVSSSEPQTRQNDWSMLGVCWKVFFIKIKFRTDFIKLTLPYLVFFRGSCNRLRLPVPRRRRQISDVGAV